MKDHLDQVLCGVVLACVGLSLTMGWQTGSDRFQQSIPVAEDITARLTARQGESPEAAKTRFRKTPIAAVLAEVETEKASIRNAWTQGAKDTRLTSGLFYHLATLNDLRDGRDLIMRFLPPRDVVAAPDIGVVRLQWRADPSNTVDSIGYVVFRKRANGSFEEISRLGAETTSWADTDVSAGVDYLYAVAAQTDEKALVAAGNALSARTPPVHVTGKVDYEIRPIRYETAGEFLRVSVRKHVNGVWHERQFDAREGQQVGAVDSGSGVDFTTGCLVQKLLATPEVVVATTTEVVLDHNGHVVLEEGKPLERERRIERTGLNVEAMLQTRSGRILRIEHRQ